MGVIKVLRTLRNHWKKSTLLAMVGWYGVDYGLDWHRNFMMMRDFSKEALVHGNRPLPQGAKNKHITLLLNPTAGNRKAKGKFEKYAEPLFHLSGFLVNVVKTERMDEARDLAGIIEKTNLIVVAGGDGTVFETVTGILRRDDAEEAIRRYPIGVIPLGLTNNFAKRLLEGPGKEDKPEPQFIAEAAMAIVRHKMKPQDLMQINIVDDYSFPIEETQPVEGEEPEKPAKKKPLYSLAGICIGQYREALKIKNEMPSLFPNYFATFLSLYKTEDKPFKAHVKYIPPCEGCLKCKTVEEKQVSSVATNIGPTESTQKELKSPSFWSKLFSIFQPVHAQETNIQANLRESVLDDSVSLVNPSCGEWNSICVETSELNINPCGEGKLQIEVGKRMNKTDFMIEGLKRYRNEKPNISHTIDCTEIEIIPQNPDDFLSVDSEEFEIKHIRIKCLKNKVHFFTP